MNFKQYQEDAKRTCPSLGSDKLDLCHMVLGMYSELEEYMNATDDVNRSEECSDINWYLANYCTFRGYSLDDLYNEELYNGFSFVINVAKLQDLIKKYIAYGKDINTVVEIELLESIAHNIMHMYRGIDIFRSLQNNIDKLKVRYPEKFTEECAINRDLVAERAELEK